MFSNTLLLSMILLQGALSGAAFAQASTLDLDEVKTAAGAHFDKLNTDGDATLETNEVKGVIGARLFKAADTDNDGTVSKDEYLALVEKLFARADADHDGTLSVQELRSKSARQLRQLIR